MRLNLLIAMSLYAALSGTAAVANPSIRMSVALSPHPARFDSHAVSRRRPSQRRVNAASCGGGSGNYTNATAAGVFVGSDNTVCDVESAVVTGNQNVIDSGSGASGYGAGDSAIGAGTNNSVSSGVSFIGAGQNNTMSGTSGFIGAGDFNVVNGLFGFVGAGEFDTASGQNASAVGGYGNTSSGERSFIGAGSGNTVGGEESAVGAGVANSVSGAGSFIGAGGTQYVSQPGYNGTTPSDQITGADSFIGAGDQDTIGATEAFIGAGGINTIGSAGSYGSIVGGNRNSISAEYASIIGGYGNGARGAYAIVAGGDSNTAAGTLTFAAGYHADAEHDGSFVWSDYSSGSAVVKDSAANQFIVRASGGTTIYSSEKLTSGVKLSAGSGSWASLSDRNAKMDVTALDDASILAKVVSLPVTTWRYDSESGVRHVGPMAQDFYAAFGVGEDDRHITSIDEDGVALAAIKALHAENVSLRRTVERLEVATAHQSSGDSSLRKAVAILSAEVARLAGAVRR